MKYFIFLFFVSICSCKKKPFPIRDNNKLILIDTLTITDEEAYINYHIKLSDLKLSYNELCIIETKRAHRDIKKNQLVFCFGYKYAKHYSSLDVLFDILKEKYNISSVTTVRGCIVNDSSEYNYCYEKLMQNEIEKRFGIDFIEKLSIESDSIYHVKNKNKTFEILNSDALLDNYQSKKYQEYHNRILKTFEKHFIYPKDYNYKNERSFSYTSADFILKKDGTIDSLFVKATFQNSKNEKHREYFENQFKAYIKTIKHKPLKAYGVKLNTYTSFNFYHK